jgi:hypothetical protein
MGERVDCKVLEHESISQRLGTEEFEEKEGRKLKVA